MANLVTVPARGAVIDASIFMASIVAMGWAATIESPSATVRGRLPRTGRATCDGSLRSAFSATGSAYDQFPRQMRFAHPLAQRVVALVKGFHRMRQRAPIPHTGAAAASALRHAASLRRLAEGTHSKRAEFLPGGARPTSTATRAARLRLRSELSVSLQVIIGRLLNRVGYSPAARLRCAKTESTGGRNG